MFNFGNDPGANFAPQDASAGIADIPMNRTFMVQKLTADEPAMPQTVHGLKTVEEAFEYFKPAVEVEMDKADGSSLNEEFRFANLGDFAPKNLINRSSYLRDLNTQQDQYSKILSQVKSNKVLKTVLENPQTREAFFDILVSLRDELNQNS